MRAVIYTRASLDLTGQGASVDRQKRACRALCEARGWTLVTDEPLSDNSISAYDDDKERPAWKKVLGMVERGEVDVVVAWHLDRITRSMLALENLIKLTQVHGVGVATATGDIDLTTDTGRMVARILAAVARAEVERKAARQKLSHAASAADGRPPQVGVRAFGYTKDGMEIIEDEAESLRWCIEQFFAGTSLPKIAEALNDKGYVNGRGTPWRVSGIRKLIANPRYAAIRTHNGVEIGPGIWPPIIDEATHRAILAKLGDPERNIGTVKVQHGRVANLLSGIARCAHCDGTVRGSSSETKAGRELRYMSCRQGHASAPRDELDLHVEKIMVAIMSKPKFADSLVPKDDARAHRAQAQIDKLRARLRRVNDANLNGAYDQDPEGYAEAVDKIKAEMSAQQAVLDATGGDARRAFAGIDLGRVVDEWNAAPMERKRAMIAAALDVKIKRRIGGAAFDPDRDVEWSRR